MFVSIMSAPDARFDMSQRVKSPALGDRLPQPRRRGRHVDVADAVGAPKRVEDRVHHRRAGTDGAGLTSPFDTERIGPARHVAGLEGEGGPSAARGSA